MIRIRYIITKKETKELYESTGGEYSGIGAVMSQNTETGVITLVQIYKDSPAEKAGLKANDILYKVEGKRSHRKRSL